MLQEAEALLDCAGLRDKSFCAVLIRWDQPFVLPRETGLPPILRESGQAFSQAKDKGGLILFSFNSFPIQAMRSARLWLFLRFMMEAMPGQVEVSQEVRHPDDLAAALETFEPVTDWWNENTQIHPSQARLHRKRLQTSLKKSQFNAIPGYVSRLANTQTLSVGEAWSLVPLLVEAVWTQFPQVPLVDLLEGLDGREMGVHPDTALIAWASQMSQILKADAGQLAAAPIDRVIASILADCSLPYSQSNLARSLGLTPAYFCRLFKEKTGCHFSQYLTQVRMEKAKELLSQPGEMHLTETAQLCGYPHKSYFCQVFKKYTGMSPGEFHHENQLV
ncbi:MAG: helix-turn-helix transcriptional regulator [Clostridia bacterium]|nr:helix-turn-helix transcriptional regulator [Clostridia bacterium]